VVVGSAAAVDLLEVMGVLKGRERATAEMEAG